MCYPGKTFDDLDPGVILDPGTLMPVDFPPGPVLFDGILDYDFDPGIEDLVFFTLIPPPGVDDLVFVDPGTLFPPPTLSSWSPNPGEL